MRTARFQQWADEHGVSFPAHPFDRERALRELAEMFSDLWNEGYDTGVYDGHRDGYDSGHDDGYAAGYEDGETDTRAERESAA